MRSLAKFIPLTIFIIAVLGVGVFAVISSRPAPEGSHREKTMHTVTSKDGTEIAYDKQGNGPALILVGGALVSRSSDAELAERLAANFTVYNYDRRGRGDSTDTQPSSVAREIEDMEAVINEAGGSVYVYGISSGAALSVEVAASLGDKVKKLALYEAPYSDAEGTAEKWKAFRSQLAARLAANDYDGAVELHLKNVGVPDGTLSQMKASPAWQDMVALAPTLAYDAAVIGEDRSIPVQRAAQIKATTLVMEGGASAELMPFMRPTADKLAQVIPNAQRRTVEGQAHDVSAEVLTPILIEFFKNE